MTKQPKSELTLALDGEVTARDLATATAAFAELLEELVAESASGVPLQWVISDLHHGSGAATAECRALDAKDAAFIPRVIEGGKRFAEEIERGGLSKTRPPKLREVERKLRLLPGARLTRVRLETPDSDYILAGLPRSSGASAALSHASFGSVTGRVQAMSNRGSLRFTMYDLNDDKAISCYLDDSADAEKLMLDIWGHIVEVEGFVRRDPATDRPVTVRGITEITTHRPIAWDAAIGAAPGFLGKEKSEDIIRRIRDE